MIDATLGRTSAKIWPVCGDLKPQGAILLISCYELGHQPLNLAFPRAYLQRVGYQPVAIDTSVESLDADVIAKARFVAVSVPMHTALRLGAQITERVRRENPDALICFYGLYAWLNAEYLLREHGDFVIGGEYEHPLLELVQALETGGSVTVAGVSDRAFRAEPSLARIDFAFPDREELPPAKEYAHLLIDGLAVPAGYTEATRGCHHTCLHCPVVPIYRGRFFAVPRQTVLEDIRRQVAQGVGHITFGDPDFLNGPTHALRICRAMHAEFPHVTFDFTARIDHILGNREIVPELRELGCVFVLTAVESISELVLRKIDKGHTKQDVIEALEVLDEAGIAMRPSLLPFTPWTTLDDYLELLEFFEAYDLIGNVDPVHFSIRLLVPPGSALLDDPDAGQWAGPLDESVYTHVWKHPDSRVDDLQRAVAKLVETAASCDADAHDTFAGVKSLACAAKGITPEAMPPMRRGPTKQPPRLTESWFC
ncbi:CUAEP/CCAEP-tail radical SAM protein [soil metagenome]